MGRIRMIEMRQNFEQSGMHRWPWVIAVVIGVVMSAGVDAGTGGGSGDDIAALIEQLGAKHYQDRELAMRSLLDRGYEARIALKPFLDSSDPEIRICVRKLYHELRWQIVPGAADDITSLIKAIDDDRKTTAGWRDFIDKHGAQTILLLIEMNRDKKYRRAAQIGLLAYLESLDTLTLLKEFEPLAKPRREQIIDLLKRVPTRAGNNSTALFKLKIYNLLGAHEEAAVNGFQGWTFWRTSSIVTETALAIEKGKLADEIWPQAGEELYKQPEVGIRCVEAVYYATLADRLGMQPVIKHLVKIADLALAPPENLLGLMDKLYDFGQHDLVARFLEKCEDAALLYLRSRAQNPGQFNVPSDDEWQRILAAADLERECFRLASLMDKYRDMRFESVLLKILELEPHKSSYDARAEEYLAHLYEDVADYTRAAVFFERGLPHIENSGSSFFYGVTSSALGEHIRHLRERGTLGGPAYSDFLRKGLSARDREDFNVAIAAFREAGDAYPELPAAHYYLYQAYKTGHYFGELKGAGARLLRIPPGTISDYVSYAKVCSDIQLLDKALEYSDKAVELGPEWPQGYLARAYVHERRGQYKNALDDLRQTLKLGMDNIQVYQAMAIVQAEMGNVHDAIVNLEQTFQFEHLPLHDYIQIWLYFLIGRMNADYSSRLADYRSVNAIAEDTWVNRLFRFCEGVIDADELLTEAAVAKTEGIVQGQLCEAHFYIGQMHLVRGQLEAARASFQRCLDYDISVFIETVWATAELRLLSNGRR